MRTCGLFRFALQRILELVIIYLYIKRNSLCQEIFTIRKSTSLLPVWRLTMHKRATLVLIPFLLSSCSLDNFTKADTIKVMIERGNDFTVNDPIKNVKKGDNATFLITIAEKTTLSFVSYDDYHVDAINETQFNLTLNNIQYPLIVSLYIAHDAVYYHPNGGEIIHGSGLDYVSVPKRFSHLRENAINAYQYFRRDGYQPIGFNTKEDLSGDTVSFGSRLSYQYNDYYVEWKKECDAQEFEYVSDYKSVTITGYKGTEEEIIIPKRIEGKPVTVIGREAFHDINLKRIYLPYGIEKIDRKAFFDTSLEEITFADDIEIIPSSAFPDTLKTVHINAVTPPKMSGTFYDTFPDKMDYLQMVKDEKKIILFSGSSTRYGYYSPYFDEAFEGYKTINMGVFAYVNVKPQLDIISAFLKEGDVLISSPEFDVNSLECQCSSYQEGQTDFEANEFSFVESDFDLLKYIDVSSYTGFFESFTAFQRSRRMMPSRGYDISAKHYDDDENYYSDDIYNIQGDLILNRPGNSKDAWIMQPLVNYTVNTITEERVNGLNARYQDLLNLGVEVYFTFSPKNRNAIDAESTAAERKKAENYLRDNLIVPVISSWEESILPGTCFYLIDNHLSTDACYERTKNVIRHLKDYIGKEEKP